MARRVTGGGAVFHQTEITYSFVVPESHPLSRRSVLASYENICVGVIAGLKELGIESSFAPINDIIASGKKISGNAQTRKLGCILQHGTILIDLDVDLMFSLLKVPAEKAKGRLIEDVKERVTSLRSLLARDVSFSEASSALQKGFAEALDLNYEGQSMLSATEQLSAVAIAKNKFANADWTGRR
ncbi:hypothetical protein MASR2M78_25550 [Treponema sp.]